MLKTIKMLNKTSKKTKKRTSKKTKSNTKKRAILALFNLELNL